MDAPSMGNRLMAELVGTFGFFFIGFSGIAASVNLPGSIAPAGVAAGFGLGLGLMIAAFGQISGGHFNPAVTFGLTVARKFPAPAVIPYWIAQLIGGFIAVLAAVIIYTNDVKDSLVTNPGPGVPDWRAMLAELVAIFLFVSVIITVATDDSAPGRASSRPSRSAASSSWQPSRSARRRAARSTPRARSTRRSGRSSSRTSGSTSSGRSWARSSRACSRWCIRDEA